MIAKITNIHFFITSWYFFLAIVTETFRCHRVLTVLLRKRGVDAINNGCELTPCAFSCKIYALFKRTAVKGFAEFYKGWLEKEDGHN